MGFGKKLAFAVLTIGLLGIAGMASAAAAVKKNGIYKGTTAAGGKVSLVTSSEGNYFAPGSKISFSAPCTDGSTFSNFLPLDGVGINGGAFSDNISDTYEGVNVVLSVEGAFSGDGTALTGSFQVKVSDSSSCDTGTQTFDADHKGSKKKKGKKRKKRR